MKKAKDSTNKRNEEPSGDSPPMRRVNVPGKRLEPLERISSPGDKAGSSAKLMPDETERVFT